ncbi:protein phosphatase 1K, mitochondrial-like [Scleropages formosus]|uniref:protein-serine/threonine phosphatase n=1 Tax=Scleropages formosus TaxID=113540 RepID=A0A0P7VPR0_SCLFO|nr:protein phosphatase 1K, mitochondrial-like [Scleropages formosus]
MSATAFVLGRHGRAILTRTVRHHQCLGPFAQLSATRDLTMTAVGRRALPRADWDTLGIWLDEPVALPPLSARYTRTSSAVAASATGCASHTGKRRENEDRFAISRLSEDVLLFAIFDGHGGDSAAEFCSKKLPYLIQRNLIQESELESVLKKSFIQIDSYFLESISTTEEEEELLSSGTTATVALLRNETELLVATVGDSRAVLCRAGKAECLTEDHNARRKDERQRIQESGGFIEWNSVGEPYVNGRLAMTRSIGDFQVKPYGVIALPEITTVNVDHNSDSFLVLTTDGVSGIMDSQEMCEIIKKCQDPSEAAYIVNDQALQYGSQDNVTTLVIPFGAWGKYKNAFRSSNFGRMMVASCRWG